MQHQVILDLLQGLVVVYHYYEPVLEQLGVYLVDPAHDALEEQYYLLDIEAVLKFLYVHELELFGFDPVYKWNYPAYLVILHHKIFALFSDTLHNIFSFDF